MVTMIVVDLLADMAATAKAVGVVATMHGKFHMNKA
jgi:hypothetical protein